MTLWVYGPPGSGKTTLGARLAESLALPFLDLDRQIESDSQAAIPEIFTREGEAGFRAREKAALRRAVNPRSQVIALGGGALLDPENRALAEAYGPVLCLRADFDSLWSRLSTEAHSRPLLADGGEQRLRQLLARREDHYSSFPLALDTGSLTLHQAAWQAQVVLGIFRVRSMGAGYEVSVLEGGRRILGEKLVDANLNGPVVLVSDVNAGKWYAGQLAASLQEAGFPVETVLLPPGEAVKNIGSVQQLWRAFLQAGIERRSVVVSLGGGVISDMTGFAAATYARGIRWVAVPTTLLAMVDASLGGKTGIDLPEGKNLVGAFHPPALVLADPQVLETLPMEELRNGMAEVVKHGVISDPALFEDCSRGLETLQVRWGTLVRRAMAVKIAVIEADPYEKGLRAALNFGHTVGHAVEQVSGYRIKHGEAVAIGMAVESRIAEELGLAEKGLAGRIIQTLSGLGLPYEIPDDMDRQAILASMQVDKKRQAGRVRFALPRCIGEVEPGVEVRDLERRVFPDG